MSKKILGLDIRDTSISAVLLKSGLKGHWLEGHAHIPFEEDQDTQDAIAQALGIIIDRMDVSGAACVAALPPDQISYRNIRVPFREKKKIRQVLPYELEPLLPYQVEDLIFDFQATATGSAADLSFLLAGAIKKETMQSFLASLAPLGLTPEIVTPGSYPTALCLNDATDGLLLDIDPSYCSIVAFTQGQVHLIRTTPALANTEQAITFLPRWIRQTVAGLHKTLTKEFDPQSISITGAGLNGSQIEQTLSKHLGLPVNRVDLIKNASSGIKNKPSQPWEPHLMDNALALALSEGSGAALLNFRRGPFSVSKHWVENKQSIITSGVLLAVVLILLLSSIILDSVNLQKKMTALDQEIHSIFKTNFPEVQKIVDPLHQMRVQIEETQQADLIPGEFGGNLRKIDILNDISRLIPETIDVEIVSIVIGEDNVVLSGNTDTFNAVDDMKSRIEKSKLIQSVTISSANLNRAGNRVRFKLKAQL